MAPILKFAALVATLAAASAAPSPQSLDSDLTILVNNDLEGSSSSQRGSGVILLSRRSYQAAVLGCQSINEQLWSPETGAAAIQSSIDYLVYQGKAAESSLFWIASQGNGPRVVDTKGQISSAEPANQLLVLCTQTAPFSTPSYADTDEKWQVTVRSNNENITGFRDRLSFRFLGLRYAPQPKRFAYSAPYEGAGGSVSATKFGSPCPTSYWGSEDCFFLNIYSPYLPNAGAGGTKKVLKPVLFWIHGGAFTDGLGSEAVFDGGPLASRGDIVVVTINYRLGNLGFLALDDGVTNGNFGLADQITALDWVRAHIEDFGGDPERITIAGQSAGAGSVRAMMASPKALGKFSGAIPLSNLGGLAYGKTYSRYYTIAQELSVVGNKVLRLTNCTEARSQVECLRDLPFTTIAGLSEKARHLVVDGVYLTSPELPLAGPRFPFHLMMGITAEDGAPFISYPKAPVNEAAYFLSTGLPPPNPALFPRPSTGNQTYDLFNQTSRLATDGIFRCVDQATAHAALRNGRIENVWYYEFDRTYQFAGWPKLSVCEAPPTAERPLGDADLPYIRCHSGELPLVFGTLARLELKVRDEKDAPFMRYVFDLFTAFVRTGNPNPESAWLKARGYDGTLREIARSGEWKPARNGELQMRVLDWPSRNGGFRDVEQCQSLGLGLDYYDGHGG